MAAKPIKRLVVKTGEYVDNTTGQTKGRWLNVGTMFKHDDGNVSLKLESTPVGNWDGWISVFDIEDKNSQPQQQSQHQYAGNGQPPQQMQNNQPPQQGGYVPGYDDDQENKIPF